MAERGGFEPSRPFISHMLPRFHAHFLSPERNSRRQNEVHRRSSTSRSAGALGSFPRTGCSPRNEQCVCPPGEGAGTDEMLVIEHRGPLGGNRKSRELRP